MPSHAWDRLITKWGGGHNRLPSWVGLFDNGEGEHLYLILLCCVSFLWSPNRLNLRLFNKFLCGGLKKPSLSFCNLDERISPSWNQGVWMVVLGLGPARITSWASTSWPSSQARITSENSLFPQKSPKEELPFINCGILLVTTGKKIMPIYSKNLKTLQKCENLPKIWKISKNLKIFQKTKNLPKIWKSSKNLKIFQKPEDLPKIWTSSKNL